MARMVSSGGAKRTSLFRIDNFKGINLADAPSLIKDNQSPDMLNLHLDERGVLNKRTGYELVRNFGTGRIKGMYYFKFEGFGGTERKLLLAEGTNIYECKLNAEGEITTVNQLSTNVVGRYISFFEMGGYIYILTGFGLYRYEYLWGGLLSKVEGAVSYVPTLTVSRTPSGGGTKYEDINLIGNRFKDSFSADGTATAYTLSLNNLDSGTVRATVNGTEIVEGSGLTVNRSTGVVTFTTAPSKGTNNVVITAFKTISGHASRINGCIFNVLYGGSNDTRVFISGNISEPSTVWASGLNDPTYWPENGFYKVGRETESVMGFAKQYDYLVIEKEYTKWVMNFNLTNDGASFPIKPINDQVGTLSRGSIQIIDNNPVSLNSNGVYMLNASNVRDERNVKHISANVDAKLLRESNLQDAISIDYDKKYWLVLNGNVYIYDYSIGEWYIYDNIHASSLCLINNVLHFGTSDGNLYRFKDTTHLTPYNDNGQPINAYWYSKLFNFNSPEYYKFTKNLFYSIKPDDHTSCNVYTITDKRGETLIGQARADKLNFWLFDFERFSFVTSDIPQEKMMKIKDKKITHIQIKLENNSLDEGFGINSVGIKFGIQKEVR